MKQKDLEKKLAKKTQDLISGGLKCDVCLNEIVYILRNKGSAGSELRYDKCEAEQITIIQQDGKVYTGYRLHECK